MALDQDPHDYQEEKEMSFLDHLEDLRWHVVRAVASIMIFTIVGFIYVDWVFNEILLAPSKASFWTWRMLCKLGHAIDKVDLLCIQDIPLVLQSRYMTGQFTITIVAAFVLGLVMAFPYVIWEAWRFIKPGLRTTERKNTTGVVGSVSFLFALGISFGYYVIAPLMVYVMVNYRISDMITNQFDVTSYVTTFVALVLGSGLLFQLPVVVFFLTKIGLLTPQFMRKYRKHAVIVILIVAAIITPPDPLSQSLISLPLYLLYEISIFISAMVMRQKRKAEEEELKQETSGT
jgi:sec-independent protein translocase protein TatC